MAVRYHTQEELDAFDMDRHAEEIKKLAQDASNNLQASAVINDENTNAEAPSAPEAVETLRQDKPSAKKTRR